MILAISGVLAVSYDTGGLKMKVQSEVTSAKNFLKLSVQIPFNDKTDEWESLTLLQVSRRRDRKGTKIAWMATW